MNPAGDAIHVDFRATAAGSTESKPVSEASLAECVRRAVHRYLVDLGDHEPEDLHHFVVSEIEKPLLEEAMQWTDGNQSRCAAMLGLSRGTLRKKLKTYQLI